MKILVIDDHPMVRNGVRQLYALDREVLVFEASDANTALPIFRQENPDVVVLDIKLKGVSGLEVLRRIRVYDPATKVVIFSACGDPAVANRAIGAGAYGYVTKAASLEELQMAIARVASGERYVDTDMSAKVSMLCTGGEDGMGKLTDREQEILRLLGEGMNLHQVASQLGSAYKTIANASSRIKDKLDLERTSDLIRFYLENLRD